MRVVVLCALLALALAQEGSWRLMSHGISVVNTTLANESKYRGRAPESAGGSTSASESGGCHFDVHMLWANDVGSGVIATPVVVPDPERDGKHVMTASYHQYIDVLDGEDGHPSPGWPFAFDDQEFVSSPIWVDWDADKTLDIVAVSKDGTVFVFDLRGQLQPGRSMRLPDLPVMKDWYEGLDSSLLTATFNMADTMTNRSMRSVDPDDGYYYDEPLSLSDRLSDNGFINVDPHVLATPVVADLDGDGFPEVVFPVTYYFDRSKYSTEQRADSKGKHIDLSMYVISGVIVYDTRTQSIRLSKQLDMTTDRSEYRAYALSSPTIGDVDRDGRPDILIGTMVGYVYAFDLEGTVLDGFPILLDQVVTQPVLIDAEQKGTQAVVVADRSGNLVAFDLAGVEIWETRFAGSPPESLSIGDVNGDGIVDIAFATTAKALYVVSGDTGMALPGFPILLPSEVVAPTTLVQLAPDAPLSIIVPGEDGHLFVVDPAATCIESIDLGEKVTARVVVDDVDANGMLDLIVATMSGNVYCIGTETPFTPILASLPAFVSPVPYGPTYFGVQVSDASRKMMHVTGRHFPVEFEIIDKRRVRDMPEYYASYRVRFLLGGTVLLSEMTVREAGVHRVNIPSPDYLVWPTVLTVEVTNELHERVGDALPIAVHVYFYRLLKWVIALPLFAMVFTVVVSLRKTQDLPL